MQKIPTEYQECLALMQWASLHPLIGEYLIKHANEGLRSPKTGFFLKRIGLRPGLPDYQLPIANNNWSGLWIEMKRRHLHDKKKLETQEAWLVKLLKVRQYATYAYGWEHAVSIIEDYINNKI
ncbi:MAG TPA: hypothetical protein VKR58_11945 [Aquella sp.]|nr:hypothetical protein [Aquella sp.]